MLQNRSLLPKVEVLSPQGDKTSICCIKLLQSVLNFYYHKITKKCKGGGYPLPLLKTSACKFLSAKGCPPPASAHAHVAEKVKTQCNIEFTYAEKNQTNAINATMSPLKQTFQVYFWKCTMERNATNVTLLLPRQAIWGDIWKHTVEKSQTNETNATMLLRIGFICFFWCRQFQETFDNTHCRKVEQIKPGHETRVT